MTNESILDAIWNDASTDYQRRVPQAGKAGLRKVLDSMGEFNVHWNEFERALINRIGLVVARSFSWTNPLARFKKGLLSNGETVEEYQMGLVEAYHWSEDSDYGADILLRREKPHAESSFHTINRQDMYKVTIQRMLLKRAFLSDGGLATFLSELMSRPAVSDQFDEFLRMCELVKEYEQRDGFFRVATTDARGKDAESAEVKKILRQIREMADTIIFPSSRYNAARMVSAPASAKDLVILTTPQFKSAIDVHGLAGAFHEGRMATNIDTVVLPEEHFLVTDSKGDKAQAVLTTSDFFQVYDTYFNVAQFDNPAGRYSNYFLHHDQIISASRFVPAVLFATGHETAITPTPKIATITNLRMIDGITGKPIEDAGTVAPGTTIRLEVDYTTDPVGMESLIDPDVVFSISGNTTSKTRVSNDGILQIGGTEKGETITITFTGQTASGPATGSVTVKVAGKTEKTWPKA